LREEKEKRQIQLKLNLTQNENKTYCFSARKLSDVNKGGALFIEVLEQIKTACRIILIGEIDIKTRKINKNPNVEVIKTGYLSDPNILADYYRVADYFICLSKQETFGLSVMEAMASSLILLVPPIPVFIENLKGRAEFFSNMEPAHIAGKIDNINSGKEELKYNYKKNIEYVNYNYSLNTLREKYLELYMQKLSIKYD